MNTFELYPDIINQKPFETAVGNALMQYTGGSGLYVNPVGKAATYDFSYSGANGQVERVEVKNDKASARYGNVDPQFQYKGNASCTATSTAATWAHHLPKQGVLAICETDALRGYISGCNPKIVCGGEGKLTRGYTIPISQLTGQAFMTIIPFTFE